MNAISPCIGIGFGPSNCKMTWYNPKTDQPRPIMNSVTAGEPLFCVAIDEEFVLKPSVAKGFASSISCACGTPVPMKMNCYPYFQGSINSEGEPETPSVVYNGENETLVGSPVLEMVDYEKERERLIVSIKRELMVTSLLALPHKALKPVEVAAEFLRKLKREVEERHFHQQVTGIAITSPASFGSLERDRIRESACLAIVTEIETQEEPVAAALTDAQMGVQPGKYILVYNLGDGTFRRAFEPQGMKRCGEDDFDEALYNYCDRIAREKPGHPISQTDKRDLHFLQGCCKHKVNLSTSECRLFKSYLESGSVLFQQEIDRPTFEGTMSASIEETVCMSKVLPERASTTGQAVDTKVFIEGSSHKPPVLRLLEKYQSSRPLQRQKRDIAVAPGAIYHAHNSQGSENKYPGGVEQAWTGRRLDRKKIAQEYTRAIKGYLDDNQVDGNERQVMGEIKDVALVRLAESVRPVSQSEILQPQAASHRVHFMLAATLRGHSSTGYFIDSSADGQLLASGRRDGTIKIWRKV